MRRCQCRVTYYSRNIVDPVLPSVPINTTVLTGCIPTEGCSGDLCIRLFRVYWVPLLVCDLVICGFTIAKVVTHGMDHFVVLLCLKKLSGVIHLCRTTLPQFGVITVRNWLRLSYETVCDVAVLLDASNLTHRSGILYYIRARLIPNLHKRW